MSCAEARPHGQRRLRSGRSRPLAGARSGVVVGSLLIAAAGAQAQSPDDIVVLPEAGQSTEQARRDRYECHNWSVEQTGTSPLQGPDRRDAQRAQRAQRVGKVVAGAAIGAAAGSVIRGARDYRDAGDGALGGAVLGAIAGAVIGKQQKDDSVDEVFAEYFRALDACMSARGYSLAMAAQER